MNILIHSNNIYFNIGLAQCFRDIQETLPGLNIIHSLPLSHLPDLAGMDVIILALENYHDYQAAAELAQRYPGLVVGFTSANNVRRGRAFTRIPPVGQPAGKRSRDRPPSAPAGRP